MTDIVVLGAEVQAASSIACAYPDRAVTFVSDHDILDGSDLVNVRMVLAKPADRAAFAEAADHVVPVCPRWIAPTRVLSLSRLFDRIESHFPGRMLPVYSNPGEQGRWILKGDLWHRPDVPLTGTAQQLADVTDTHGCGIVYQELCDLSATIMAIGRREHGVYLGCVQVYDERFFWDNILQAGETVDAPDVVAASLETLDALDHHGFFTMNWLRTSHGLRLSSLRPVPRAVFQMFQREGVDLLENPLGLKLVRAGLRFVAAPTYVSFERLGM
jgi:hypothetical protein